MRPLIGIPCHSDYRAGNGRPIYCNNRAYVHALEHAGAVPILIPLLEDPRTLNALLPRLDGLLLSGGGDVQPERYGEDPHPNLEMPGDSRLDEIELTLASWALQEDIPTLGVCRGMQLMNVAAGGSLYQDLPDQYPSNIRHCNRDLPRTHLSHRVFVKPSSIMAGVLGTHDFEANSLHHQAVKTPGKDVHISGYAGDGVAELLEIPGYRFMMAVQCHPEEIYQDVPACARLFEAFVQACSTIVPEDVNVQPAASQQEMTTRVA
jgi:putative glutamine amidotransferase